MSERSKRATISCVEWKSADIYIYVYVCMYVCIVFFNGMFTCVSMNFVDSVTISTFHTGA